MEINIKLDVREIDGNEPKTIAIRSYHTLKYPPICRGDIVLKVAGVEYYVNARELALAVSSSSAAVT